MWAYIHWNPEPVLFSIGSLDLRWYSILWLISLMLALVVAGKVLSDLT